MQPKTRAEFVEYCMRKLGHPVLRVNISPEQIDDRVDEAINRFQECHYNATEEQYYLIQITEQNVTDGYIDLPSDVLVVANIWRPSGTGSTLFSPEYQTYMSEINTYNQNLRQNVGIDHLFMTRSHFSLIKHFLVPELTFSYNAKTKRLRIAGGLANLRTQDGALILHAYKTLAMENPDNITDLEVFENLWTDKWLQNYATELMRLQWGQNLSKFQNVQLVGGVTLNGDQIKEEARANIEKLDEQLQLEYTAPIIGYMV